MSTPQDLQAIVANFQTALEASSLKAAANQCLKDIAARDNPTTLAYERPLILAVVPVVWTVTGEE